MKTLTPLAKLTLAGLVAAVAGIAIQIAAGVDYPAVPPGLVMLVVAIGLLVFVRRGWSTYVVIAVAAFLTIGAFVAPSARDHLFSPANDGTLIGTVIQLAGDVLALVTALLAVRRRPGSQRARRPSSTMP